MFSFPRVYYTIIVKPSVERFLHDPTAYDLCFSSCIFLYHFSDVYAEANGIKTADALAKIRAANYLVDVVHAVCTAAKHVIIRNAKMGPFVGLMAEHAVIGKCAAFSDGSYFSDGTSFAEHGDTIRVETPDGNLHDLTHVVNSVAKTIENQFI